MHECGSGSSPRGLFSNQGWRPEAMARLREPHFLGCARSILDGYSIKRSCDIDVGFYDWFIS